LGTITDLFLHVFTTGASVSLSFYATLNLIIALKFKRRSPIRGNVSSEKVVVLVPVRDDPSIFNSHPHLKKMDYPNYRIVIVDDSLDPIFNKKLDSLKDEKTVILHRTEHVGKKSGALNYALDIISDLKPKYVVIFDADHRPTEDFLKKGLAAIEQAKVKCVCGYQKHDIGRYDLFGKFYEACHAAGIINFQGRNQLGIATIFGGGCGVFEYEWLRNKKFDVTSITEDWELSLRGYLEKDFSILIRDDLFARCAIPKNYKWFITQQLRWSEGTTRDFRRYLRRIITTDLPWRTKLGIVYQGLYYAMAWAILASWILAIFHVSLFPTPMAISLLVYYGASWSYLYARGAKLENFSNILTIKCLLLGFLLAHFMIPIYCYSTLRGAITGRIGWIVTRRRG